MSLSRLAEKCRNCPKVDTCDHKKMEALGLLPGEPTLEDTIKKGTASVAVMGICGSGLNASLLYQAIREPIMSGAQFESRRLTDDIHRQIANQLGVPSNLLGGSENGKE